MQRLCLVSCGLLLGSCSCCWQHAAGMTKNGRCNLWRRPSGPAHLRLFRPPGFCRVPLSSPTKTPPSCIMKLKASRLHHHSATTTTSRMSPEHQPDQVLPRDGQSQRAARSFASNLEHLPPATLSRCDPLCTAFVIEKSLLQSRYRQSPRTCITTLQKRTRQSWR